MPDPSAQGEQEVQAFAHRIGPFIVFFHTLAPAELTQGKPAESSVGTGFLVQFQGRKYFVSALHNFFYKECALTGVIASWEAAKFKFRGTQPVNFEDARNFQPGKMTLDTGVSLPHSFPKGLVIDQDHDLIAVEVGGDHGHFATAQFLNLEQDMYSGDLQDQMSLVTLGNPFAGRIPIPGNQKASALIPHLDHVLFDANLDTSWAATDYLSPDYFFMPYSLHQEQVAPHGFSGAPVFVQGGSDAEPVWIATPRVVGAVLRYFPRHHAIAAVKMQVVVRMLETNTN
jgi:hypothetical protein